MSFESSSSFLSSSLSLTSHFVLVSFQPSTSLPDMLLSTVELLEVLEELRPLVSSSSSLSSRRRLEGSSLPRLVSSRLSTSGIGLSLPLIFYSLLQSPPCLPSELPSPEPRRRSSESRESSRETEKSSTLDLTPLFSESTEEELMGSPVEDSE